MQVRLTESGLEAVSSALPGVVNAALGSGFCVPETSSIDFVVASAVACNDPICTGRATGCDVDVTLQSVSTSIPAANTFRIDATVDADARVPVYVDWPWPFSDSDCELYAELDDGRLVADVRFGTRASDGELTVTLQNVRALDLDGLIIDGSDCGTLGDIFGSVIEFAADMLSTQIGEFLVDQLSPRLNEYIQSFLPDPLGIEGQVDLHELIGRGTPEEAALEVSAVAGGYVSLPRNGLSLGMIVGLNADSNPATRTAGLASEVARCVPALLAPNLGAPPASLTRLARGSYSLPAAEEFVGNPDPADTDLAIGISETVLDQAGHHAVTSGGLCLGFGTAQIPQITLGALGLLIPSLGDLGEATAPLLLVLRPQKAIDASIGDGTDVSPNITLAIRTLEIDVYAWLDERYVRTFTVVLDLDAGVNLGFGTAAGGVTTVTPELVGIDSESVHVTIENSELLKESPEEIAAIFPALVDLILPQLGGALPGFELPPLGGFSFTPTSVTKVVTSADDFVAILANVGPGTRTRELELSVPFSERAREILARGAVAAVAQVDTQARVAAVRTPSPADIRAGLAGRGGALPEITVAIGADPRALEAQWSLDGGMWHPYKAVVDGTIVVRDRSLAIQGHHQLAVRARAVGSVQSADPTPDVFDVVVDSVAPVMTHMGKVDGDTLTFAATDLVTADGTLLWAVGDPDGDGEIPDSDWVAGGTFSIASIQHALRGGRLLVFVKDEAGNVTQTETDVGGLLGFHGKASGSEGCSCRVGGRVGGRGSAPTGGVALAILGGAVLLAGRARRRVLGALAMCLGLALAVGCSSAESGGPGEEGPECELASECTCDGDRVPLCENNMCACQNELVLGEIGKHADLGVGPGGTAYVSAYNERYGDLMVAKVTASGRVPDDAWEFVDGIPDGPVAVQGSLVRGGIQADGDDVGLMTSLAVGSDSTPRVAYYDATHRGLRYAQLGAGGVWTTMDVDAGSTGDGEFLGEVAGRSPTLLLADDGTPGIAYQAVIGDAEGKRAEIRWAVASNPNPTGAQDWTVTVAASHDVPDLDDGELGPPDLANEPGIFVTAALKADGTPWIAYYDRPTGALRSVQWTDGAFTQPARLDGGGAEDVGWYPSAWIDGEDVAHVAYVDAQNDDLLFLSMGSTPELVDDGYREDGMTSDGLPRPVFHMVGDDSSVLMSGGTTVVVYQDATTHELLMGERAEDGTWSHTALAGAESPFAGAYGFYASAELAGTDAWIATTVYDPPSYSQWVEVFVESLGIE